MIRPITNFEKNFILGIAERLPEDQKARLVFDMEHASAEIDVDDNSWVVFHIKGYQRPPYEGEIPFDIEGRIKDQDGSDVSVILHLDQNRRLFELEMIKWGEGDLINPKWDDIQYVKTEITSFSK